jgi:hypothetical protein
MLMDRIAQLPKRKLGALKSTRGAAAGWGTLKAVGPELQNRAELKAKRMLLKVPKRRAKH